MISVCSLHPLFVAEVAGVDLRLPLYPATSNAILEAMDHHAVLVFRRQPVDNLQQIAFSQNFGEVETTVGAALASHRSRMGDPRIAEVSNLAPDGSIRAPDDRWRLMQGANQLWHTDSSFKHRPGKFSLLSAHECPAHGGETEFADLRAAYEALDDETRMEIADLQAVHSISYSRSLFGYTELAEEAAHAFPPVLQPLVRVHPGSHRRALYLASHASQIAGWSRDRGRALLDRLTAHATQSRFVHRHHWRAGDLVMWDNRCTMHRGRPYDDLEQHRDMRRTTVIDDVLAPFVEDAW